MLPIGKFIKDMEVFIVFSCKFFMIKIFKKRAGAKKAIFILKFSMIQNGLHCSYSYQLFIKKAKEAKSKQMCNFK